jgi:phage tail-like protein
MRGLVPGLDTPYPLGAQLPAVLQEDVVTMLLTSGLDEVLAPVIGALDSLYGYLDPALAPPDFLNWLGGWVGLDEEEDWPPHRRREFVAAAVDLYRVRGTAAGLRRHVELVSGGEVELADTGGVTWSQTPTEPADDPPPSITVTVRGGEADRAAVEALIATAKPAHVEHHVEVG